MIVLHDFFRSGASHRVRIALHLKGLPFRQISRHLRKGDQRAPDYLRLNPQGLVLTLVDGDVVVTQSLAIMEYLDETHPDTSPLLPRNAAARARVRAICGVIAADTHPLNNLRVLAYLEADLELADAARTAWCRHWLGESFTALEAMLQATATGRFCHGDIPSLADACLAPQMVSAARFGFDVTPYTNVCRVAEAAAALDAFRAAEPGRQPDSD